MKLISLFIISFIFMSCAKDDDSSSSSSSQSAFSSAVLKMESALVDNAPKFKTSSSKSRLQEKTAFGSLWTTDDAFPEPGDPWGNSGVSIQESLGQYMNESKQNSVFQRVRTPIMISCIIGELAEMDGETLKNGSGQTFTIDTSNTNVKTCFGSDTDSMNNVGGKTITYTVADTTDTTTYDKVITMTYADNNFFGSDQTMYVRNNDTTLNFHHVETRYNNGSALNEIQLQTTQYTKSSGKILYEFVTDSTEASDDRFNMYRVYIDPDAEEGRLIAGAGDADNSVNDYIAFVVTADQIEPTKVGVSVEWALSGTSSAISPSSGSDYEACVSTTDGSISADNDISSGTCGATGVSISAVTVLDTARAYTSITTYKKGETKSLSFTFSDIGTSTTDL